MSGKRKVDCNCVICVPDGRRGHPVYGYDLDKAKMSKCTVCQEPIGEEEVVEDLSMARFGDMAVRHERCETEKMARERAQMERNWVRRVRKWAKEDPDNECAQRVAEAAVVLDEKLKRGEKL